MIRRNKRNGAKPRIRRNSSRVRKPRLVRVPSLEKRPEFVSLHHRLATLKKAYERLNSAVEGLKQSGALEDRARHDFANVLNNINFRLIGAELELTDKPNAISDDVAIEKFFKSKAELAEKFLRSGKYLIQAGNDVLHRASGGQKRMCNARRLANYVFSFPRGIREFSENQIFLFNRCSPSVNLMADPRWLSSMIMNFTTNALRAIPAKEKGIVEVRVKTNQKNLEIRVSDTGIGMTREQKEKFLRNTRFTTKDGPRHGIGLDVIYQTIRMHNGTVAVSNNHPRGTIFLIKIPFSQRAG